MEVPQINPESPRMISQGPSVCIFNKEDPDVVLASWIFVQYLLTNEVQIPYSQTEGYIPVTHKAQNSDIYNDYLSRKGEDNELYYNVKIEATELLINNIENTFVTPVFNGSASLRSASGQMIENVTKSVKRKEKVDEAFVDNLFDDMVSLYRLENVSSDKLPKASLILLIGLGAVWCFIILYFIKQAFNARKNKKIRGRY
jgi:multiple sugar transport system substrate-binding protein